MRARADGNWATRCYQMKTHVEGRRDERRESLAQLEEAGRRLADPIWKGFGEGERVQVVGLSKAPDFNGRAATVLRFDGERFAVRIDGAPRAVRCLLHFHFHLHLHFQPHPAPAASYRGSRASHLCTYTLALT